MNVLDILAGAQNGEALANLAKAYGIAPSEAKAAVDAVVPQLSRRIERNTLNRGGIADLLELIGNPDFQKILHDPGALAAPETQELGKAALDEILWSKDKSRAVAAKAAAATGLSETLVKSMLPAIAALVAGSLGQGSSEAIARIAPQLPLPIPGEAPIRRSPTPRPAPPFDIPSRPPAPAPANFPPGGGVGPQRPLPIPGDDIGRRGGDPRDNPYGDLGDIIRRGRRIQIPMPDGGGGVPGGGQMPGGGANGSVLGHLIRAILAGLLGFQNRGFLAWLVRLILFRWGWGFVKWLLGRIFGR